MFVHQHPDRRSGPKLECTRSNRRGIGVRGYHQTQCLSRLAVRLPASLRQGTPQDGTASVPAARVESEVPESTRARHALTPAFREPRTWTGPVAPHERIDLGHRTSNGKESDIRTRTMCAASRGAHSASSGPSAFRRQKWSKVTFGLAVVRRPVLVRPDTHPCEPAGDPLRARMRAIHTDAQHGIVAPRAVLPHTAMHAEDSALARITNVRSTIDENSQGGALADAPGQSITRYLGPTVI